MAKYAKSDYDYSIQENNTIEWIILQSGRAGYLESCGPNALENCASAMWGYDTVVDLLSVGPLKERFQPADLIFLHMNDPLRAEEYNAIYKTDTWRNRLAIFYPHVASKLLDMNSEYIDYIDFELLEDHLKCGHTAQVCLLDPGHFISIVDYEDDLFYFHDSWPGRFIDRNGFYRPITRNELLHNTHHVMILYYKD